MAQDKISFELGFGSQKTNIDVFGKWSADMEKIKRELPEIQKTVLNTAGFIIKQSLKDTLVEKWPAAGRSFTIKTPKHPLAKKPYITKSDPIVEGIRQTSNKGGTVKIYVGTGDANTAGYLAKMYEHDSKKRYYYKRLGRPLKKPHYTGKLTGVRFFNQGINNKLNEADNAVTRIINNRIKKIMDIQD